MSEYRDLFVRQGAFDAVMVEAESVIFIIFLVFITISGGSVLSDMRGVAGEKFPAKFLDSLIRKVCLVESMKVSLEKSASAMRQEDRQAPR